MLKDKTTVLKFGGSSVANADCIKQVCEIAIRESENANLVIVVSAMGKATDSLVKLAKEFNPLPEGRELDMLLSTGEQVTVSLVAMCLHQMGFKAISLVASQAGFITERAHNRARIAQIKTDRIEDYEDEKLNHLINEYFTKNKIKNFKVQEIKLQITGQFNHNIK